MFRLAPNNNFSHIVCQLSGLSDQVSGLSGRLSELSGLLSGLSDQLSELSGHPSYPVSYPGYPTSCPSYPTSYPGWSTSCPTIRLATWAIIVWSCTCTLCLRTNNDNIMTTKILWQCDSGVLNFQSFLLKLPYFSTLGWGSLTKYLCLNNRWRWEVLQVYWGTGGVERFRKCFEIETKLRDRLHKNETPKWFPKAYWERR